MSRHEALKPPESRLPRTSEAHRRVVEGPCRRSCRGTLLYFLASRLPWLFHCKCIAFIAVKSDRFYISQSNPNISPFNLNNTQTSTIPAPYFYTFFSILYQLILSIIFITFSYIIYILTKTCIIHHIVSQIYLFSRASNLDG